MSTQAEMKPISHRDKHTAGVYDALITRYRGLPIDRAVPLMAVRLLTLRWGLDKLFEQLVKHGSAVIAERARHEIALRQQFMARMLAEHPPEDPKEGEAAIEEMAEDLAAIDCPDGGLYLLTYIDRLRNRELMRNANNGTVH